MKFDGIDKLGPEQGDDSRHPGDVSGPRPKLATCVVSVIHDDLPDSNNSRTWPASRSRARGRAAAQPALNGKSPHEDAACDPRAYGARHHS